MADAIGSETMFTPKRGFYAAGSVTIFINVFQVRAVQFKMADSWYTDFDNIYNGNY